MNNTKRLVLWSCGSLISALAVLLLAGCQSGKATCKDKMAAPCAPAVTQQPAQPPATAVKTIRIDAGSTSSYTDPEGNVWLPDQGFADGDTVERASDLPIANTKNPVLYRTERYGMTSFSYKLPNGKYTVKLHFAETYEGITGPGQRVFSFNVE